MIGDTDEPLRVDACVSNPPYSAKWSNKDKEGDPRFAEDYAFMIATARFWHANRPWLLEGEMEAPGNMDAAARSVSFMVRSTYSKQGDYRVVTDEALPVVFHSVWTSPDGRTAAILVNWTRETQSFRLDLGDRVLEGALPPRTWRRLDM